MFKMMRGDRCAPSSNASAVAASSGVPVHLNVYDLTPMNGYVYWLGLGIYHSGIEAHGAEYAFGAHDYATSGVFEVEPKHCPGFTFRRSVLLGTTNLSALEFRSFIEQCADEYHGNTYHLIAKNCNHFSDDISRRLIARSIPGWVNRLARIGYMCNCLLPEGLQVTVRETSAVFPNGCESERAFGQGKEMVESEGDQECALITIPNGNMQSLLRDSFKEVCMCQAHGDYVKRKKSCVKVCGSVFWLFWQHPLHVMCICYTVVHCRLCLRICKRQQNWVVQMQVHHLHSSITKMRNLWKKPSIHTVKFSLFFLEKVLGSSQTFLGTSSL